MLTAARNDILTRVGPGDADGHSVAPLLDADCRRQRVHGRERRSSRCACYGEDLTLYRDGGGGYGLVARHCSHRGADLSYGTVEEHRHPLLLSRLEIRRARHPASNSRMRTSPIPIRNLAQAARSPPIRCVSSPACCGPIWAREPTPELPVWEPFTFANGFREIVKADVPCNCFCARRTLSTPCTSNGCTRTGARSCVAQDKKAARHLKIAYDEFEHGFVYRRVREGQADGGSRTGRSAASRCGRTLSISACISNGACRWTTRTRFLIAWFFMRVPKGREPYRAGGESPPGSRRRATHRGRWIDSHVINQDIIGWVGQGAYCRPHQRELAFERSRHPVECASASSPTSTRWRRVWTRPASSAIPPRPNVCRCPT